MDLESIEWNQWIGLWSVLKRWCCIMQVFNYLEWIIFNNKHLFIRLMNAIKPGSITGEIKSGTDFKTKRHNIEKFLKACQSYGVEKQLLFEVDDLLLMQNIPKVTRCLFALGKLVRLTNCFYNV